MRNLAVRRFAAERRKAKARRILRLRRRRFGEAGADQVDPVHLGALAATPAPCSCSVCGNPRRHFDEKTLAEKRAEDAFQAGIDETRD
jgi:hypothetical protein